MGYLKQLGEGQLTYTPDIRLFAVVTFIFTVLYHKCSAYIRMLFPLVIVRSSGSEWVRKAISVSFF